MADIVARLRRAAYVMFMDGYHSKDLAEEAAGYIERLTKERDNLKNVSEDFSSNIDVAREHVANLVARIGKLEKALEQIAGHPEKHSDGGTSYAVGWAFWNVQNIARAALTDAKGGGDGA